MKTARRCTEEQFHSWYRNNWQEIEANAFASELLMPEGLFRASVDSHPPDRTLVEKLAKKFDVSLTAACIRYAQVGAHPCIVFVSKDGIIQWFWPSRDNLGKHLLKGDRVNPGSAAGEYFENGVIDESDDSATYYDWFVDEDKGAKIHETAFCLPSFNTVVSMVWFS